MHHAWDENAYKIFENLMVKDYLGNEGVNGRIT
jgi:hypothetical protein